MPIHKSLVHPNSAGCLPLSLVPAPFIARPMSLPTHGSLSSGYSSAPNCYGTNAGGGSGGYSGSMSLTAAPTPGGLSTYNSGGGGGGGGGRGYGNGHSSYNSAVYNGAGAGVDQQVMRHVHELQASTVRMQHEAAELTQVRPPNNHETLYAVKLRTIITNSVLYSYV